MKSSVALATAGLLLVSLQLAESLKTVGKSHLTQQQQQPFSQQEQDFQQESLQSQQQIELLQQQQQQAELQIQQENEEAQRQLQQQQVPLRSSHSWFGLKGGVGPSVLAQQQNTFSGKSLLASSHESRQFVPNNNPYNGVPPQSTIAYLIVRPPYAQQLASYGEDLNAYRNLGALLRPAAYPQQQQPLVRQSDWGTKGGSKTPEVEAQAPLQQQQLIEEPPRQEPITQQQQELEQRPLEQKPIEQQPIVQQQQQPIVQQSPPALVVPVAKEGKLKALLDKIMSKFSHGTATYSVASEEMIYPQQQPQSPLVQAQQQPIEQQQIQHQIPEQELRLPEQQQQQQLELPQQQQQQLGSNEQGFGEEQKLAGESKAPAQQQQLEHVRQPASAPAKGQQDQDQLQLLQQQQSISEQEISRQPQQQPIKGQLQLQPARQPEPIVQQQQQLEIKSRRPLQLVQEPIRQQEAKNPTAGF